MTKFQSINNNRTQVFTYLFMFVIFLTVIQQFPVIKDLYYSYVRILIYILFSVLLLISLGSFKKFMKIKFMKIFIFSVIGATLLYFVYFLSDLNPSFIELLIPLGILIISISFKFTNKDFKIIILGYTFLTLLMAVSNVIYYVGGFQISQFYEIPGKNQIGPIIGSSIIILGVAIIRNDFANLFVKYYSYINFIILFACLLVTRNRASIVAIIFIFLLIFFLNLFKNLSYQKLLFLNMIVILIIILTILGVLNPVYAFLWDSLTLNFELNDFDSLSSGRTDTYIAAIHQIAETSLFGELFNNSNLLSNPHNFILNKIVSYGLIGAFPVIILYFYLIIFTLKGIIRERGSASLIYWLLLYSIIISQFEYTYPFGPGVSQIILWFILGFFLSKKENKHVNSAYE